MTYAVVTDSAATLPAETALRLGIGIVPLGVTIDGVGSADTEIDIAGFYRALARGAVLTSSQPAPGALAAAYRRAAIAGADRVWSLHLGSALSSTVEVARLVAADAPVPVHVVDTGTASMAEGLCVLAAVGALRRDRDADVRDALLRRCRSGAPGASFLRYTVAPSIAVHTGATVGYIVSSLDPAFF